MMSLNMAASIWCSQPRSSKLSNEKEAGFSVYKETEVKMACGEPIMSHEKLLLSLTTESKSNNIIWNKGQWTKGENVD